MKKFKSEKAERSNLNQRFPFSLFHFFTFSFFFLFHFFTFPVFGQDVEQLSNQIRFGTTEVKRDTLFQIRNYRRAETSRAALPALRDENEIIRATAAFSVIFLPKDESLAALLPNLSDKSEIVRRETAYALGAIENPNAAAPLVALYERDKIPEVRNAAIVGLGTTGNASAIPVLTKILTAKPKEENEFTRRAAARSIGQIAQIIQTNESYTVTPENFLPEKYKPLALEKYKNLAADFAQFRDAVPVLIRVLQNNKETDDARREAAFALGAIGDSRALDALNRNLASKDNYLAEICKEAITKIQSVTR